MLVLIILMEHFLIMYSYMILKDLKVMALVRKRSHEKDGNQCNLFDQTTLLFKQIDQCVMLASVYRCLVIHNEVKIDDKLVSLVQWIRHLWVHQQPFIELDEINLFRVIPESCEIIVKFDCALLQPVFIDCDVFTWRCFCWIKHIFIHLLDVIFWMFLQIRFLLVDKHVQSILAEEIILLSFGSTCLVLEDSID